MFLQQLCLLSCLILGLQLSSSAQWIEPDIGFTHPYGNGDGIQKASDGSIWACFQTDIDPIQSVFFRSLDNGQTWEQRFVQPDTIGNMANLYFYAKDSLNIWGAYLQVLNPFSPNETRWSKGVYQSNDGGLSWSKTPLLQADSLISPVYIHFFDQDTGLVYFYNIGFWFPQIDESSFSIQRTVDGGASWDTVSLSNITPYPYMSLMDIKPDMIAHMGDTAWMPTQDGAIIRSTDKGASWTRFEVDPAAGGDIINVAFRDHLHGLLTKGFVFGGPSAFMQAYRTDDGGATWTRIDAPRRIESFHHVPGSGGVWIGEATARLSAGYFISKDDGLTWQREGLDGYYQNFHFVSPTEGYCSSTSVELFNSFFGVNFLPNFFLRTYNGPPLVYDANFSDGLKFAPQAKGLLPNGFALAALDGVDEQVCWAVAYVPGQSDSVPAAQELYVVRTLDGGTTWELINVLEGMGRTGMDIQAKNDLEAWITTSDLGGGAGQGLISTSDGGQSWTEVYTGDQSPGSLHFFDDTSAVLFERGAISFSLDGGQNWNALPTAQAPVLDSLENVYTGNGTRNLTALDDHLWFTTSEGRVFHSRDRGQNWTVAEIEPGVWFTGLAFQDSLTGLAVAPYFGNGSFKIPPSVWKTTDGGATWTNTGFQQLWYDFQAISFIPGTENSYLITSASADAMGLYTTDGGSTWEVLPDGGALGAIDFVSPDAGWMTHNAPAADSLYPNMYGYQGDLFTEFVGIENLFAVATPLTVYPNPATSHLQVEIPESVQSQTTPLQILDLQGRVVLQTMTEAFQAKQVLDIDHLSTGLYQVIIRDHDQQFASKFLKQ